MDKENATKNTSPSIVRKKIKAVASSADDAAAASDASSSSGAAAVVMSKTKQRRREREEKLEKKIVATGDLLRKQRAECKGPWRQNAECMATATELMVLKYLHPKFRHETCPKGADDVQTRIRVRWPLIVDGKCVFVQRTWRNKAQLKAAAVMRAVEESSAKKMGSPVKFRGFTIVSSYADDQVQPVVTLNSSSSSSGDNKDNKDNKNNNNNNNNKKADPKGDAAQKENVSSTPRIALEEGDVITLPVTFPGPKFKMSLTVRLEPMCDELEAFQKQTALRRAEHEKLMAIHQEEKKKRLAQEKKEGGKSKKNKRKGRRGRR